MTTVQELEAKILAGETIDPAHMAAAQQAEAASRRIAELQSEREKSLAREAYISRRRDDLLDIQKQFEELQGGSDARLKNLWLGIATAIKNYAAAVNNRNADLKRVADTLSDEGINPTEGLVYPYRFSADNGSVTISGETLRFVDAVAEVERATGLTLGQFAPAHPAFNGFGGEVAAREAGIR